MKMLMFAGIVLALAGCDAATTAAAPVAAPIAEAVAAVHPADQAWNVADADAMTNGNLAIAAAKFMRGDELPAGKAAAADVVKAPWKFYGKRMCFRGEVGQVEDLPPGNPDAAALGGDVSELIAVADDGTILDMLIIGGSDSISAGDTLNVCGLVAGRSEVDNRVGGSFRHLVMVGKRKPIDQG